MDNDMVRNEALIPAGEDADHGVEAISLDRQGPARQAGLLPGDIVVSIARQSVSSVDDILHGLADWPLNTFLPLGFIRGKDLCEAVVTTPEAA